MVRVKEFLAAHKWLWRVFTVLTVLIIVFIFTNSMRNADESNAMSNVFVDFLEKYFPGTQERLTTIVRKTAHFTEFTLLAVFAGLSFITKNPDKFYERIIYVLFIGLLTACTDEFIQLFSEGRSSQIRDVFIDFSGVCTGAAVCIIVYSVLQIMARRRE